MVLGEQYPDIAKQLLFLHMWRPSRRDIRICFRSMYFTGSTFSSPRRNYYITDPEYVSMSAQARAAFEHSLALPAYVPFISIRGTQITMDNKYTINIPVCRFVMLRTLYLRHNLANIAHMYMCIAHVHMGYKFCKNYILLLLNKYPFISRVCNATVPYYSLYEIDTYFGSRGAFTNAVDVTGQTIYMPISEIAGVLRDCTVIVPNNNGDISVELSDGRRIFKIYLSNIEYIQPNAIQ
jgi:hypothetical protein